MAGRMILIKSVAQTLPSYTMQTFLLPRGLLTKMERKMKHFFLGIQGRKNIQLTSQSMEGCVQIYISWRSRFQEIGNYESSFRNKDGMITEYSIGQDMGQDGAS